jgi:hypothetical protein
MYVVLREVNLGTFDEPSIWSATLGGKFDTHAEAKRHMAELIEEKPFFKGELRITEATE